MLQACLRRSASTGTQTGKEHGPGRAHILERTNGPQGQYVGWLMVINAIEKMQQRVGRWSVWTEIAILEKVSGKTFPEKLILKRRPGGQAGSYAGTWRG